MIRSILAAPTFSAADITSRAEVASYQITGSGFCIIEIELTDLNAAAATIIADVEITRWSRQNPIADRVVVTKRAAADTSMILLLPLIPIINSDTVKVFIESSNANDTTTSGRVRFDDASVVDALAISGSTAAAANVEANITNLDASVDAIKIKTDNLPADTATAINGVAHPGDAMTLAADAITAATYDETTAHPLTQADTGTTAAARTGATAVTMSDLSLGQGDIYQDTTAIKAKTDNLPANPAGEGTALAARNAAESVDAKLTDARAANLDNLDAAVTTRATQAQVNTEVALALSDYDAPTRAEATADKVELLTAISDAALAGDGDTLVNHDTGGADNLRIADVDGDGIDGVAIRAYLKTDYDTDAVNAEVRGGPVYTGADGRWVSPMMLNSGLTYVIVYSRAGFVTVTKEVTIP